MREVPHDPLRSVAATSQFFHALHSPRQQKTLLHLKETRSSHPTGTDLFLHSHDVLHMLAACEHCRQHALPIARNYERIHRAIEYTGDSVVITDCNGKIEYVNPAFEVTTGYSAAEVIGKTPRVLKSGVHDEAFYNMLWTSLLEGRTFRGTIVNRKKNGEHYSSEQTISPVRGPDGSITHFVSVLKDITLLLRRKEQEFLMQLAREIQQRFYAATGKVKGFDLHAKALPVAETGGDYFDFLPGADGCLTALLADVSGHGFSAALIMSETRAYCRAFSTIHNSCDEILERVNERLYSDLAGKAFATMSMLRINPNDRTVVFSGAGHVPAVLAPAHGSLRLLRSAALPLGLFANARICSGGPIHVESGDTFVLMTDGITESKAADGEELGLAGALNVIASMRGRSAQEISDALVGAALSHARGRGQDDDIAVLVCRAE